MKSTIDLSVEEIKDIFVHEYIFIQDTHEDLSESDVPLIKWFFENIIAVPDELSHEMEYMLGVDDAVLKGRDIVIEGEIFRTADVKIMHFNRPVHNLKEFLNKASSTTKKLFDFKHIYSKLVLTDEVDEFEFNENTFKRIFIEATSRVQLAFAQDLKNYINDYNAPINIHETNQIGCFNG